MTIGRLINVGWGGPVIAPPLLPRIQHVSAPVISPAPPPPGPRFVPGAMPAPPAPAPPPQPGENLPVRQQQQLADRLASMAATAAADREAAAAARVAAGEATAARLRAAYPNVDVLTRAEVAQRYHANPQVGTIHDQMRWVQAELEARRVASTPPPSDPNAAQRALAAARAAAAAAAAKALTKEGVTKIVMTKVLGVSVLHQMLSPTRLGAHDQGVIIYPDGMVSPGGDRPLETLQEYLQEEHVRIYFGGGLGETERVDNAPRTEAGTPDGWAMDQRDP